MVIGGSAIVIVTYEVLARGIYTCYAETGIRKSEFLVKPCEPLTVSARVGNLLMTQSVINNARSETTETAAELCPDCETDTIIHDPDRGERVCEECGLVLTEDPIDYGPEWRAFNAQEHDELSRVARHSPNRCTTVA